MGWQGSVNVCCARDDGRFLLDNEVNHSDINGRSLQGGILGILIGHVLEQAHDVAE